MSTSLKFYLAKQPPGIRAARSATLPVSLSYGGSNYLLSMVEHDTHSEIETDIELAPGWTGSLESVKQLLIDNKVFNLWWYVRHTLALWGVTPDEVGSIPA